MSVLHRETCWILRIWRVEGRGRADPRSGKLCRIRSAEPWNSSAHARHSRKCRFCDRSSSGQARGRGSGRAFEVVFRRERRIVGTARSTQGQLGYPNVRFGCLDVVVLLKPSRIASCKVRANGSTVCTPTRVRFDAGFAPLSLELPPAAFLAAEFSAFDPSAIIRDSADPMSSGGNLILLHINGLSHVLCRVLFLLGVSHRCQRQDADQKNACRRRRSFCGGFYLRLLAAKAVLQVVLEQPPPCRDLAEDRQLAPVIPDRVEKPARRAA